MKRFQICGAIAHHINAFRVKQSLAESTTPVVNLSVYAARDIATLEEVDWAWLGKSATVVADSSTSFRTMVLRSIMECRSWQDAITSWVIVDLVTVDHLLKFN